MKYGTNRKGDKKMTVRYERLCAQVTADIIQMQMSNGYEQFDEDAVLDTVAIYNDLIAGNIYRHIAFYEEELEECDCDEIKEIIDRLKDLTEYDRKLQMAEMYRTIESNRYFLQVASCRTEDGIQYAVFDRNRRDYINNKNTGNIYFFAKTYSVPSGEAVNIKIRNKVYTFLSVDRVKEC